MNETGGFNEEQECYSLPEDVSEKLDILAFWLEGVLVIIIGFVGLICNTIAIPLLFSKQLDNIFNRILVCLEVADNLYLATTVTESFRRYVVSSDFLQRAYIHFFHQLQNISLMSSNSITVVLAIERYIAVTRPTEYHFNVTLSGESPWKRVAKYLIPTLFFTVLFNIPKFFELESSESIQQVEVFDSSNNATNIHNQTVIVCKMTDLRLNKNYSLFYVHLSRLFVTGIIPVSALVYLNRGIYR